MGLRLLTPAAWETLAYAAPGAGHLVPFTKESLNAAYERIEDESLVGSGSRGASAQGPLRAGGDAEHNLDYNNFDNIFEAYCGANASRVFTMTNDDLAKYVLIELEKVIQRHRYYPAKIGGLVISGSASGGKITVKPKFHTRLRAISATAFPVGCTLAGAQDLVLFKHLNFRIGDQVDALGAGDNMGISSFELTLERNMAAQDNDSMSPTYILDPIPGGWRDAKLKLTFPRYNSVTAVLATWKDAETALQARFAFAGPSSQTFVIEVPNLRIATGFDVPIEGPGPIKFDGELSAHRSDAGNPMYVGEEVRFTFT